MLKRPRATVRKYLTVVFRQGVENMLNLTGLLNVTPLLLSRKNSRRKIAFQAYSTHLAQFYQPIISDLSKEPDQFEITFIVLPHPHFSFGSIWKLKEFANSKLHLPRENIKFYWETLWDEFDLMICTDVYAKFPLRRTKRWLLKHGPGVVSRIIRSSGLHSKTIFNFDRILLTGEYDFQMIKAHCDDEAILLKLMPIGFPFLDRLESPQMTKESYFRKLSLDMNRKTVLVAPSWRGLRFSAMDATYFQEIIPILRSFDLNIVIKLHQSSFGDIMADGVDWQKELENLSRDSDIHIDYDIDDVPALKHSDILITTTSSSRTYNFMLLDKPVILYPDVDDAGDPLDKERVELMRQGAFGAMSPSDIRAILRRLPEEDPLMSRERCRVARQCFANPGKATEAVVRLIKKESGG